MPLTLSASVIAVFLGHGHCFILLSVAQYIGLEHIRVELAMSVATEGL